MRKLSYWPREIALIGILGRLIFARRSVLAAISLVVVLIGSLAVVAAQEVSIKILVNDDPISDYDIDQRERFLAITTQKQPSPALKKQATDMLIDERLQIQEARKAGITPDEGDVMKILTDMAQKNNLDVNGLAAALAKGGVNIKTLKDRIRSQMVWQQTVQKKFRRDIEIADADVDKVLSESDESAKDGAAEPGLQLSQVKFAIPAGASQKTIAAQIAAAETLRTRFGGCADLAKGVDGASVKTLQDQSASSLVQPARLLVMNAKVGQMTPPTITRAAVELYAVCGKSSATHDDTARDKVERQLLNKEMGLRAERLLRDIRQEAFIEYR
jgi:peptidyl-prolyl cis-trans isomerase SurA